MQIESGYTNKTLISEIVIQNEQSMCWLNLITGIIYTKYNKRKK